MFVFQSSLSAPLHSMMSKTKLLLCEIRGTYDRNLISYIFVHLYYIKNIYLQLFEQVGNRHSVCNIVEREMYNIK